MDVYNVAWQSSFNWLPYFFVVEQCIILESHNEYADSHFC